MKELAGGEPLYEVQRIKQKLEKKFKSKVLIGKILGQKTVICFKNMANCIVSNKWYEKRKANVEDETNWIIETAAEIIGSNIKQFLLSKFDLPSFSMTGYIDFQTSHSADFELLKIDSHFTDLEDVKIDLSRLSLLTVSRLQLFYCFWTKL